MNKPYLQIIRIIFDDLRRSVWKFPVPKLYSVTGTFLKLYITDSVITSKHCAKFCETDKLCISLIQMYTISQIANDHLQGYLTIGKDSSLYKHCRCIFVAPFHNDQRTITPYGQCNQTMQFAQQQRMLD